MWDFSIPLATHLLGTFTWESNSACVKSSLDCSAAAACAFRPAVFPSAADGNLTPQVNIEVVLGFSLFLASHILSIGKPSKYIQNPIISQQSTMTTLIGATIILHLGHRKSLQSALSSTCLPSCRPFAPSSRESCKLVHGTSRNPISLREKAKSCNPTWPVPAIVSQPPLVLLSCSVTPLRHPGHLTVPHTFSVLSHLRALPRKLCAQTSSWFNCTNLSSPCPYLPFSVSLFWPLSLIQQTTLTPTFLMLLTLLGSSFFDNMYHLLTYNVTHSSVLLFTVYLPIYPQGNSMRVGIFVYWCILSTYN